jgi:hypothetical protein
MGYFTTLADAEEWLNVVREIYPGAWAGEAPGKKLRARAAAAAAAQAQHALGPQPHSALPNLPPPVPMAPAARAAAATASPTPAARAPAPVHARPAPAVAPTQAAVPVARAGELKPSAPRAPALAAPASLEPAGITVPTVHAAAPSPAAPTFSPPVVSPPVLTAPVAKAAPVQSRAQVAPQQVAAPVARAAPVAPVRAQSAGTSTRTALETPSSAALKAAPTAVGIKSRAEAVPAPVAAPTRVPVTGGSAPSTASKQRPGTKSSKGTAFADSNVREVLAALDDTDDMAETGQTRMMPAPQIPRIDDVTENAPLTDTQVLRYLETRRSDDEGSPGRIGEDPPDASISLLKPDDTGTRRALKEAVSQNAPVAFAVQLQWAVQPVELEKVPPLAIFSAYTLYTVEGSREGRKWYGLRLGFFSDAISAKQVAYYVRSEFASVAVVPVSPQEKTRATEEDTKKAHAPTFPRKARQGPVDEFKLIDPDDEAKAAAPGSRPTDLRPAAKPAAAPSAAAKSASQPAAAKRTPPKVGGRINARERRGPQTLEETLEILGAGQLEMDNGSGETLNDTGVRHLRVEVQKNTPFSRLLERLSERTKTKKN